MGSETTAAATGAQGVVRRDPFAMLPFCGYNMAEYFEHWLGLGERLSSRGAPLPRIYCVNWFRTDEQGKFVWPGFGENMRVLRWIVERAEGRAQGFEHVFGITPRYRDLHWAGLEFPAERYERITSIDRDAWQVEFKLHDELFAMLAQRLPASLLAVKKDLQGRLAA
jgi:phosphoenolpyruvate carboxykinase (GTP)